jgi:site-specific recombinase XerD
MPAVSKLQEDPLMAKMPFLEEHQLRDMISIAGVTGYSPARDAALLSVLYGTGVLLAELVGMKVSDYLAVSGAVRHNSVLRAEITYNNVERPLYWVSPKVIAAVNTYLAIRVAEGQGVSARESEYRGLDPDSSLFLRATGGRYKLTARKLSSGEICYSCDALGEVIRKLHTQAGIDGNTNVARRTFAVRLYQKGYDLRNIATLLGHKSLETTRALVEDASIHVSLGDLVAGVL